MIGFRYANKNKYQKFSKISEPKFRQIIRYFALDLTASDTARLTGISVRSINNLYLKLRVRLAQLATDGWRAYDGLVDVGYEKHFRVHHGNNEFARGNQHINGIESFWSYAKGRLAKFKGVAKHTFYLHLKETEFRFNHRHQNVYKTLLKMLREKSLS